MHFLINSYQKCIEQYLDSTNVVRKKINILVNEHEYEEVGMKIDMIYVANDNTVLQNKNNALWGVNASTLVRQILCNIYVQHANFSMSLM